MKLGTYIVSGLIFLFALAGVAYILAPSNYELIIFDIPITLPVAIWVLIPSLLLFLVSILHIAFYGTKSFLKYRKWLKDAKELKDAIYWSLLKEPRRHIYSTQDIKSFAPLLDSSTIDIKDDVNISNDKIAKVVKLIESIKDGEYIDLRENGIDSYLSKENEISIQNGLNRLKKEPSFAKILLQKQDAYSSKLIDEALKVAIREWDFEELSRYAKMIDRESFYQILDLVDEDKKDKFNLNSLRAFIDYDKFECRDFMRVAKSIIKKFSPDTNLTFVRDMAKSSPKAQSAYLYTMFEYEMRDNIKRFFDEHDESDFKLFRVYNEIKAMGKNIKLDEIINSHTVCNDS